MGKIDSSKVKKMVNKLSSLDNELSRLVAGKKKAEQDIRNTASKVTIPITDETLDATLLVRQLNTYRKEQELLVNVARIYEESHSIIEENVPRTKALMGGLSSLFSSAKDKELAAEAYEKLSQLEQGDYASEAEELLAEYKRKHSFSAGSPWEDFRANSAAYYSLLDSIKEDKADVSAKNTKTTYISDELMTSIESVELHLEGLHANLRRYQFFGTQYIIHQKNVLLGDEMGLGKTMQALAAFTHLASEGADHFLVVCPLSVVVNWTREIEKFTDLNVIEIYSKGRDEEMQQWVREGGVGITTFETLNKVPVPEGTAIDMMVVDEAHYVKNPKAQRTQSVMGAISNAERVLFMTGTPLENKVSEMVFLVSLLQQDVADRLTEDTKQYKKTIAPVYLRRVKEDVLKELPPLIEKEEWGNMNSKELEFYKAAILENNFMAARQLSWHIGDMSQSTKAERLMEICDEMISSGRKIIVFSFFKNTLNTVAEMLGERCAGIIDGSVSSEDRQKIIDKYSSDETGDVLVCQVQAAGVGLNIQAASVIVFCEPQLKPSIETQAIARAYRMGQTETVMVHRLLIRSSIDERIMDILKEKAMLFQNYADDSLVGDMNMEALGESAGEIIDSKKLMEEEAKRMAADY
ncbi:DEAD/DEAH box helicase [Eubacterium xylanophilum]|uniref:DEAD/DEAH box helicase n=1 Tax=Eubacterium xylanophilum TaxID=39497 RepID=UPI0004AE1F1B|nr:DEAD/DEAH box helicase [Eubacterium xylanophilum]